MSLPEFLTPNFKSEEFFSRRREGGPKEVPPPTEFYKNLFRLAKNLQIIRNLVGPLTVNSGYRTPEWNKEVGGVPNSYHLTAQAADIKSNKYTGPELASIIEKLIADGKIQNGGLGTYDNFVHYDVRPFRARWDGTIAQAKKKE